MKCDTRVLLHRILKSDNFVRHLMEIYNEVRTSGDKQVSPVGGAIIICYFLLVNYELFLASACCKQLQAQVAS